MKPSHVFDADLHEPGSAAAEGLCSYHARRGVRDEACQGDAVVSFQDDFGGWQSGCAAALEKLVEKGEIEPLGQGA
ncbi:MAG: hypothetical protein JWN68_1262 [Nocardioides sp.]|jgi:hypothetical protein|uniref:hypothetical protein n=1 Tax=Nocardioides sp. TaxID=35761 RepID=UPI0026243786|nr:hypothetical protein [Nocardioides sp.]MCW2833309.1 hypothetical protein [Nocardioides sp.]